MAGDARPVEVSEAAAVDRLLDALESGDDLSRLDGMPPAVVRFADYLARCERGENVEFSVFCAAHAEFEPALRRLHEHWRQRSEASGAPAAVTPRSTSQRYDMLGEVGRGGMGTVLRVFDRDLRRTVAMKVITERRVDRRAMARFVEEAQVTGQLAHPGIVPVHDLGVDDDGRSYYTMPLVDGMSLKAVIELVHGGDPQWPFPRALGVLLRVCEAVAFAHVKGVVHRDLKPSNVMVGGFGEVYVMDWGLAHVLADVAGMVESVRHRFAATTGSPIVTTEGEVLGTPVYMAPEQARGEPIGRPADVYAIGAMLYHLVTRCMPYFDPGTEPTDAAAVVARVRGGPPSPVHVLAPQTPVEIAAICERAMARLPQARYASMSELADDLRAYLDNRVVKAHRTGAAVELRMWIRRNKGMAAALLAAVLVLGIGAIGTTTQFFRAERRATEAQANAAAAEKRERETAMVADFQAGMLQDLDVEAMGRALLVDLRSEVTKDLERRNVGAAEQQAALQAIDACLLPFLGTTISRRLVDREMLAKAAGVARQRFATLPAVEARIQWGIGFAAERIGTYERAAESLARAVDLGERSHGADDARVLTARSDLAFVFHRRGESARAVAELRDVLARQERVLGRDNLATIRTLVNLALANGWDSGGTQAEALHQESVERSRRVLGEDDELTLNAVGNAALFLQQQGKLAEAETMFRDGLARRRRLQGDDHRETLVNLNNFGLLLLARQELDTAESVFREAVDRQRRVLGDDHPATLRALSNLGNAVAGLGRLAEAEPLFREVCSSMSRLLGAQHVDVLTARLNFATLQQQQGKLDEAEPLLRQALDTQRRVLGDGHHLSIITATNLGGLLQDQRRFDEAQPLLEDALARARSLHDAVHPETLDVIAALAGLRALRGDAAAAEVLYRELLAGRREVFGEDHPATLEALASFVELLTSGGRFTAAEELLRAAHDLHRRSDERSVSAAQRVAGMLAELHAAWDRVEPGRGHDEQSAHWRQQALAASERRDG